MRFASKEHRDLAAWAVPLGWRWTIGNGGHLRWDHPEVAGPVFTAKTPRHPESRKDFQKLRTALRRATGEDIQ